jgi:hypothetical protein
LGREVIPYLNSGCLAEEIRLDGKREEKESLGKSSRALGLVLC